MGQSCPISKSATSDRSPTAPLCVVAPYALVAPWCASSVYLRQQYVFALAVHPRRGRRAVDRVARLSLDEEAFRIVTYAEQIGAFCIGG